ncbi:MULTISPECIES: hypothetical protein [unclassified Rhodanobacter]|uniref:AAA+ ATPase domain-containing protein n=1 Tax=Rhodanobacter humi TaxID=1888173 RepID=A0ABV4AM69_9GAMM
MPKRKLELLKRTQTHATELVNRIRETATSTGVVVVLGLSDADWLDLDDLLASIADATGPKVLFFGNGVADRSAIAAEMVGSGQLMEVIGDFSEVLSRLEVAGRYSPDQAASPDDPGRVTLGSGALNITPALRLRVEASGSIVDDEWTVEPSLVNAAEADIEFRRFHGGLGGFRLLMEGVLKGFSIKREFESDLWRAVQANLDRHPKSDGTVVLYGQSGTGKTLALARAAIYLRVQSKLPVLVATSRLPNYQDVEVFCEQAEKAGADATVLIVDANLPAHRYKDFANGLKSRGRRILVIGSSYESEEYESSNELGYVHAPVDLTEVEHHSLLELVRSHWSRGAAVSFGVEDGSNMLAMLYRHLSPGREKITAGLATEARHFERQLRERSKTVPVARGLSQLASQLVELGIAPSEGGVFDDQNVPDHLAQDSAAKLVDYVMVAGRLNCPVPLNLLMRVLSTKAPDLSLEQIAFLFRDLDLFRWKTGGAEGAEFMLAPRLQIEAELICRRRVADAAREIAYLVDLILGARSTGVDSSAERDFLFDLLQKLDRDGPRKDSYKAGYLEFANALKALRVSAGVRDASLMLRESVFRRQAVWSIDGGSAINASEHESLEILDSARATIEEALALIEAGEVRASKRTRLNLTAERASIYGYLAVQRQKASDTEGSWSDYLAARIASAKAIAMSDDYHALDIALWTSGDMLKSSTLPEARKAEVIAELYSVLDLVDGHSLRSSQRQRFLERSSRIASLIGDADLGADAVRELASVAPAAAIFLVAREMGKRMFDLDAEVDSNMIEVARTVSEFLLSKSGGVETEDFRCYRLLLQSKWIELTGQRLFHEERGSVPANPERAHELLEIVRRLNELLGSSTRNQERYLEAVLTWIVGDAVAAVEMWKSLSRDTEYEDRSRVVRRLVLSDESGSPKRFGGRVEGVGQSGWKVRVTGLNASVSLLEHDFPGEQLAPGRELQEFGIAFNYVGPIADPLVRPARRR